MEWGSYGGGHGEFGPIGGLATDAAGNVYVVDSSHDRIERFNLEGGEAMQWGAYGNGPGRFSYPRGVAANSSEVIVTDDDNHRIEKFDPNGNFQGAAGSNGTGP